ncbi:MAG TPA: hypothetical protein H9852_02035 [Candidatus Mediterraneibacter colneyensis]|nr:hypothetical protein [Candidatus Mediterraneibacter colneyensis]
MKQIRLYLAAGTVFVVILGTLMHFVYGWSGRNLLAGLVSPVNESTWEHMKLIFFPVLLWSLFLPRQLSAKAASLRPALLAGGLLGTFLIPVLFYTYSGVLGRHIFQADIAVFLTGVFATFLFAWKFRDSERLRRNRTVICFLTGLLAVLFLIFTLAPPDIGLFAAPGAS